MTPDMTTMFVDVQHPDETASERSDPQRPKLELAGWPGRWAPALYDCRNPETRRRHHRQLTDLERFA